MKNQKFALLKAAYPEVRFVARGNSLIAIGEQQKLEALSLLIQSILKEIESVGHLPNARLRELLSMPPERIKPRSKEEYQASFILKGHDGKIIRARTQGQQAFLKAAEENDITFAIGPAGTGKTFMAVAIALRALKQKKVKKIILARPAVEAGENLGFLPGDLKEKVDPYLRPFYDALEEMLSSERLKAYMEQQIIEIVPLAFMRGRSLNQCFMLLDEAQNATLLQLKMFLTRMGMHSKAIITGDPTQIDLPAEKPSGLLKTIELLKNIKGIAVVHLHESDVVRHPLVKAIIAAYEEDSKRHAS